MKVRFGRDIYCQRCGKDDRIVLDWFAQFSYEFKCLRCGVKVIEKNRSGPAPECFGSFTLSGNSPYDVEECSECEWKSECSERT